MNYFNYYLQIDHLGNIQRTPFFNWDDVIGYLCTSRESDKSAGFRDNNRGIALWIFLNNLYHSFDVPEEKKTYSNREEMQKIVNKIEREGKRVALDPLNKNYYTYDPRDTVFEINKAFFQVYVSRHKWINRIPDQRLYTEAVQQNFGEIKYKFYLNKEVIDPIIQEYWNLPYKSPYDIEQRTPILQIEPWNYKNVD